MPQLGDWVATFELPETGYIEIHKTRGPDHYAVVALPGILKEHVMSVQPLR